MTDDSSKCVRMVAARVIGTLGALLPSRTAEAAQFLLENFERGQSISESDWEPYYEGLLDLTRVPEKSRPPATKDRGISDIDPAVVEAARLMPHPTN